MKILLNVIGSIALALAVLGMFLPLLPTVPFLLLASACYMRGSERMHRWLLGNRLFGRYLNDIENRRGIPRSAKLVSIALLWASLLFSIYRFESVLLKAALAAAGAGVSMLERIAGRCRDRVRTRREAAQGAARRSGWTPVQAPQRRAAPFWPEPVGQPREAAACVVTSPCRSTATTRRRASHSTASRGCATLHRPAIRSDIENENAGAPVARCRSALT